MLGSVVRLQVAVQKFAYLGLRDLRTPTIEIVVKAVIGPRKINVTERHTRRRQLLHDALDVLGPDELVVSAVQEQGRRRLRADVFDGRGRRIGLWRRSGRPAQIVLKHARGVNHVRATRVRVVPGQVSRAVEGDDGAHARILSVAWTGPEGWIVRGVGGEQRQLSTGRAAKERQPLGVHMVLRGVVLDAGNRTFDVRELRRKTLCAVRQPVFHIIVFVKLPLNAELTG